MNFSFKKYIAILAFVIICIGITVPLGYMSTSATSSSNKPPVLEIPKEDKPSTDENGEEIVVPTFKNGFDAWAYSQNLIKNGKGTHFFYYSVSNANVYGIEQKQYIYSEIAYNQTQKSELVISTCDISVGENSIRAAYQEGDTVQRRITESINKDGVSSIKDVTPNWTSGVETYSSEDYFTNISTLSFQLFSHELTKTTCKQNYFKSSGNYYNFSFTFNVDYIPTLYIRNYEVSAGAKNMKFISTSFDFVISKKTLKPYQIIKNEVYEMNCRGFDLHVEASTTYSFLAVDEDVVVTNPTI